MISPLRMFWHVTIVCVWALSLLMLALLGWGALIWLLSRLVEVATW